MTRDSGAVKLMVEDVDEQALASLHESEADALDRFFDDDRNEMVLEYRLVTAIVR